MSRMTSVSVTTSTPRKKIGKQSSQQSLAGVSPVAGHVNRSERRTVTPMTPVQESTEESSASPHTLDTDSGFFSFADVSSGVSSLMYCEQSSCSSPTCPADLSSSPTLEQALLCQQDLEEQKYWGELYTQNTAPDYDLAELVRSLRIKSGVLQPPPSSSPTSPSHVMASPAKLLGLLPCSLSSSALPKLPSRPDWESEETEETHSSTPAPDCSLLPSHTLQSSPTESPPSTWTGQLPPKILHNPTFSSKIFLGGVPWDVTESSLVQAFKQFGPIRIEWPGKDTSPSPPQGLCLRYLRVRAEHPSPPVAV